MPTEAAGSAWFLLAHQDDEFGVFEQMHRERQRGRRVRVAYFTSGVAPGGNPAQRNGESLRVLARHGVGPADVLFAGESLGIADGSLAEQLEPAAQWLWAQWRASAPQAVYAPAWEGGHPDHDSLCAVAAGVCHRAGRLARLRQFPLYHGRHCPGPLFRVLDPLAENGPAERAPIPWRRRAAQLRDCLGYPSQWKSWVGLLPMVVLHHLARGNQSLQAVDAARIGQRPHAGRLYYEQRGFATWPAMAGRIAAFRLQWLEAPPAAPPQA